MRTITFSSGLRPLVLRDVTLDHPWRWLAAGWFDLCCEPLLALGYGCVFTGIGVMLFAGLDAWGLGALILPLGLGFVLVAPAAAVGLYEVSRCLDRGQPVGVRHALAAFSRNPGQIALAGLVLVIALVVWVRLAMLEFMLFFGDAPPALDDLLGAVLTTSAGVKLLLVGTLSGGAVAATVFATTVVAIPMLVDRPELDALSAMAASMDVVRANPRVMALWAFLIGLFTLSAAMTVVGLVVLLPLLGHASWHAYRDLVEPAP